MAKKYFYTSNQKGNENYIFDELGNDVTPRGGLSEFSKNLQGGDEFYIPSVLGGGGVARSEIGGQYFNKISGDNLSRYINDPSPFDADVYEPTNGQARSYMAEQEANSLGDYFVPMGDSGRPTGAFQYIDPATKQDRFSYVYGKESSINQADSAKKGGSGKIMKTLVPLAIGAAATGGLATALGGLGGAAAGGTATLPSSSALLAAPVGTSAGAGASAGGLASSLLSGAAAKGAALGGVGGYLKEGTLSGALKGAGIGGVTGGIGNYISSGASIPGLGSAAETINWNQGGSSILRPGSGVLGSLTRGASSLGLTGGSGGSNSMFGSLFKAGSGVLDYKKGQDENDELFRRIGEANDRSSAALSPYSQAGTNATNQLSAALSAGFNPQDLQNDPGYQFRLKQGQQALDRQLAASGMGQSGAALKAAQDYGQGVAAQEYQDAYNRWVSQNQQLQSLSNSGLGAINTQGDLTRDTAMASAANYATQNNSRRKLLSEILGGLM